ncbi:putative RNA-directed DNA polymerase [Aphis craccivora]|uniref:Putative RNA-directed DNA polymerase n=1 Tax=Aphis craccivora TaxID=307492 RepID=A0A6G0YL63_APHCR|nr:putative RNA-directed DNA polymerase [Aphis craccivora]
MPHAQTTPPYYSQISIDCQPLSNQYNPPPLHTHINWDNFHKSILQKTSLKIRLKTKNDIDEAPTHTPTSLIANFADDKALIATSHDPTVAFGTHPRTSLKWYK